MGLKQITHARKKISEFEDIVIETIQNQAEMKKTEKNGHQ